MCLLSGYSLKTIDFPVTFFAMQSEFIVILDSFGLIDERHFDVGRIPLDLGITDYPLHREPAHFSGTAVGEVVHYFFGTEEFPWDPALEGVIFIALFHQGAKIQ